MNIIGQDKILKKIDKLNVSTFPRSLLLVGEKGSGKHLISSYISNKLELEMIDISNDISQELIDMIYLQVEPRIYLIDTSLISVKDENTILKFLEEPLKNTFIILLTTSKNLLLSTIINRCQSWELEPYSKEVLSMFISETDNKDMLLEITNTPGKVKDLSTLGIEKIVEICNKIFEVVSVNNISNTLTITNKINFNNKETEKYDFDLFVDVLLYCIKEKAIKSCIPGEERRIVEYYKLTNKLSNERRIAHINKKLLFEHYLLEMREV